MVESAEKWSAYVGHFVAAYEQGCRFLGKNKKGARAPQGSLASLCPDRATVLICSPHPDDELLCGALALRLKQERNCRIINLALTLGSDPAAQERRLAELREACAVVDFELLLAKEPIGFESIRPEISRHDQSGWQAMVADLLSLFQETEPDLLIMPHAGDGHPAHQGTYLLASEALRFYSKATGQRLPVAETGFWHPHPEPRLLVSLEPADLVLLLRGLEKHAGEMARNPYLLQMPARMMVNAGLGSEMLQGMGQEGVRPLFGELYGLVRYEQGRCTTWAAQLFA